MLLQFILYDLPVASLHPLQILERLIKLVSSVENHYSGALNTVLYVLNYLRHDLDDARLQILFVNTLRTE